MICQNCNSSFPVSIKIDGKRYILNSRKYCFDCSPYKQHNTRKIIHNEKQKPLRTCGNGRIYPTIEDRLKDYDWIEIQNFYDSGGVWTDIVEKYNIPNNLLADAVKLGRLKTIKNRKTAKCGGKPHTPESKEKIRQARLKHLAANPNESSWRAVQGKDSGPCKFVKDFLISKNIDFTPELQPLLHKNRYFSMDITFPEKMIAWEINGNQHYDTNSDLKPYYQTRHELIEAEGWTIIEIRYYNAYKEKFLLDLIEEYNLK